eukprot:m.229609 g.229609  ORF g.229609 m.229609 type:complete len:68 (-) comp13885_c1_seq1:6865-7068(-)
MTYSSTEAKSTRSCSVTQWHSGRRSTTTKGNRIKMNTNIRTNTYIHVCSQQSKHAKTTQQNHIHSIQ